MTKNVLWLTTLAIMESFNSKFFSFDRQIFRRLKISFLTWCNFNFVFIPFSFFLRYLIKKSKQGSMLYITIYMNISCWQTYFDESNKTFKLRYFPIYKNACVVILDRLNIHWSSEKFSYVRFFHWNSCMINESHKNHFMECEAYHSCNS